MNKRLSILAFSYGFPSINSRFIRDELIYLNENHQLIYLHVNPVKNEAEDGQGILNLHVPFKQFVIVRKLYWWLWKLQILCDFSNYSFKSNLENQLSEFNPHIIHCHFAYEGLMLYDNFNFKGPWIFHFHGYDASEMLNNQSYVRRLSKIARKKNVFFIYCSENIKQKLKNKGVQNSRCLVLHYGIDLNHFRYEETHPHSGMRFIHVSNLQEKKGLVYSLAAFSAFKKREKGFNSKFIIVGGSGLPLKQLQDKILQMGLEEDVELLGQKSREEVMKALNSAHVFVHHSTTGSNGDQEGIPNAIMEAMALGLPVLSTYHSGIPELVTDGEHGYLSPEKDVAHMTEQMIKIADWPSFRLKACREKIEKEFNKNIHLDELMRFYEKAISETTGQ